MVGSRWASGASALVGTMSVSPGQAVLTRAGEWVRYSTPEGAEYIAVCLPAFAPDTVHRDES